jgi:hypothetical protein
LNAPVHVHIDFIWLGIEDMMAFEDVYFAWLKERIKQIPPQPLLDDKAYEVVQWILNYNKEQ